MARARVASIGFAVFLACAVAATVSGDARVNYAFGQVAVKVIDDRGNELLVVKNLREAEA